MILQISSEYYGPGISITFPATMDQVCQKTAELRDCDTLFIRGEGIVWHFAERIKTADLNSETGIQKLNQLSETVDTMDHAAQQVFAGALRAESINGVDDILRIASRLGQYEFIEGVTSDKELGGWVVEHGLAGVNFPKETWPYLDYAGLGAKYYSDHGGAYTASGYVKHRENFPALDAEELFLIRLTLSTSTGNFPLNLPVSDEKLEQAKEMLGLEDFAQASISGVQFANPSLAELVPLDAVTVEEANELAGWLQQMEQEDDAVAKYCAVLAVEQPDTFSQALTIAMDADDYELVPEDMDEYGKQVLRRIGADDELLDTIDGYMDFTQLGEDSMQEDGVRRTEFGLVRRLSLPYPQQEEIGPTLC